MAKIHQNKKGISNLFIFLHSIFYLDSVKHIYTVK